MNNYKINIVTIGDELLIGQTIDTNSAWLGELLFAHGYEINQILSIQDKPHKINEALDLCIPQTDITILTGGLGPTIDDKTKSTLAEYFGMELKLSIDVLDHIEELLGNRGVPINELNRNQAFLPEGCIVMKNFQGTAPGMIFEKEGKWIVSLPGVPYEMKALVKNDLLPRLLRLFPPQGTQFEMIMTTGLPESVLAAKLQSWEEKKAENISLAYLPSPGIVKLRLSTSGRDTEALKLILATERNEIISLIPHNIFSLKVETLQQKVGELLRTINGTLAVAESCTGGNIGHLITTVPGSSQYFSGGVIAYENEVKSGLLSVDPRLIEEHGAVSEAVVVSMAQNARRLFSVDYALATSGIAGPDGGTEDKPVGTVWIALASKDRVVSRLFNFGNHRDRNITRASLAALNMLRLELLENNAELPRY